MAFTRADFVLEKIDLLESNPDMYEDKKVRVLKLKLRLKQNIFFCVGEKGAKIFDLHLMKISIIAWQLACLVLTMLSAG